MNIEIAIGEKIRTLRKERGITQEQLAEYLGISFQSVSKWECGDAYPDITMLPKIALFFNVTTDDLLCIDKLIEKNEMEEYQNRCNEALSLGRTAEAVAAMREAVARYPGNYKIMYYLASAMRFDANNASDKESQQNTWNEIVTLGEKIRAECRDDIIRSNIIELMVYGYSALGEKEKAKKLIHENLSRLWVSQERMLESVLEGDELIKQRQRNLTQFAELCCLEMLDLSMSFKPADRIEVLENIVKIFAMIYSDGNYGYYHVWVPVYHLEAANMYLKLNNNAKTLEHLSAAARHAVAFDRLVTNASYTAPLVDKISFEGLATSEQGNQSYQLLKKLDDVIYDAIRKTSEFSQIIGELKKHADN